MKSQSDSGVQNVAIIHLRSFICDSWIAVSDSREISFWIELYSSRWQIFGPNKKRPPGKERFHSRCGVDFFLSIVSHSFIYFVGCVKRQTRFGTYDSALNEWQIKGRNIVAALQMLRSIICDLWFAIYDLLTRICGWFRFESSGWQIFAASKASVVGGSVWFLYLSSLIRVHFVRCERRQEWFGNPCVAIRMSQFDVGDTCKTIVANSVQQMMVRKENVAAFILRSHVCFRSFAIFDLRPRFRNFVSTRVDWLLFVSPRRGWAMHAYFSRTCLPAGWGVAVIFIKL